MLKILYTLSMVSLYLKYIYSVGNEDSSRRNKERYCVAFISEVEEWPSKKNGRPSSGGKDVVHHPCSLCKVKGYNWAACKAKCLLPFS